MGRWRARRSRWTEASRRACVVRARAGAAGARACAARLWWAAACVVLALASAPSAFGQVAPRAIAWGAPDSLQLQLLDVRIERRLLGVTLEAYQSGSRTWVPLRALAEVLG